MNPTRYGGGQDRPRTAYTGLSSLLRPPLGDRAEQATRPIQRITSRGKRN